MTTKDVFPESFGQKHERARHTAKYSDVRGLYSKLRWLVYSDLPTRFCRTWAGRPGPALALPTRAGFPLCVRALHAETTSDGHRRRRFPQGLRRAPLATEAWGPWRGTPSILGSLP